MKKLYVSNLNFNANEGDVASLFETFGTVTEVKVIFDRDTNRSRGFGFVTFEDDNAATDAMNSLHDTEFMGRNLKIDVAADKPRSSHSRGGFRQNNTARY